MGRTQVFQGIELVIPDAYSALDLSRLLTPTSGGVGIVALVGESDGGKPGLHVIPGGASSAVVKKELKGGPGANMARLALRSGVDELVQGGASTLLFFKTNQSTRSQLIVGGVVSEVNGLDFTGLTGASFDVVGAGKKLSLAGSLAFLWFKVTDGANTQTPPTGSGVAIEVDVLSADNASALATKAASAITLAAVSGITSAIAALAVVTVTYSAGDKTPDASAGNSGVAVTTSTQGDDYDFIIKTKQYGAFTALYTAEIATSLGQKFLTIRDENGVPETSSGVGAKDFFKINRSTAGSCTAAQVSLQYVGGFLRLKGEHNVGAGLVTALDYDVSLLNLNQIKSLVEGNNAGWTVTIPSAGDGQVKLTDMDMVQTAQSCFDATVYGFKASVYELIQWATTSSQLVEIVRGVENGVDGVPGTLAMASLTGGTRGTSTNTNVQDALNALLDLRVNIIVPLFSSNNQDGSTVVLASVNSMVKDHVSSRSAILGKSECQAYVSIKGNKQAFIDECARMGSRWVSVSSQQVVDNDIDGNNVTFDEYAFAVVCAQTQAGSPIGTPLTHRLLPVSGLKQDVSWSPTVDGPELIRKGALLAGLDENNQPRIIAGYTSWLADTNNANIYIETVESLAIFAFNHRQFMKQKFLGRSNFTRQDILDAIKASLEAERDTTRSIKGFDLEQTKILSATAGRLEYELGVVPFEGIVFVLPTIIAIRETA